MGNKAFNVVTYSGTGSTQSITGVGFQPDLIWIKRRNSTDWHQITDAVRGTNSQLFSNDTSAEDTATDKITAFDSDGFTVSTHTGVNASGGTYVAWCWKAGGTGVSNTNGSITSTVSANADAGFSIVSYTGNSTPNSTVGHGLSSAPEMIICKNRSAVKTWIIGSDEIAWTKTIQFTTAAATTHDAFYNTAPSSSVFTIGDASELNSSGNSIIAYCFHSVDGYSKVGSYTGNGSTDGTFVYTSFAPKYVMIKVTDLSAGESWHIFDKPRSVHNLTDDPLYANNSSAEDTNASGGGGRQMDLLSNGFKLRGNNDGVNKSGYTWIYIAFAESPFKHTNAR